MKIRAIVPILLISLVVGISMACNTGSNPAVPGHGALKYVGADFCVGCHISIGEEWSGTRHSTDSWSDIKDSDHLGDNCITCHTTGFNGNGADSGFDDPDPETADRFAAVGCESCHGPGSDHIATREPLPSNFDAALCGSCHTGSRHGAYDEWALSAHADALAGPREESSHFGTACLECHSADYIFADAVPEDATPFDFQFGITCQVCHDPHNAGSPGQLRKKIVDLCAECHTAEGAKPGSTPHHPNADIYQGSGGYEYPGETYTNSAHTLFEDGCAECHMYSVPYNFTGNSEPKVWGHSWLPVVQACMECHPDATDFDVYGQQTFTQGLLDELKAELDAATDADKLTIAYERAKFNYDICGAEGSLGVHNPKYVHKLLQDAIDNFEPTP